MQMTRKSNRLLIPLPDFEQIFRIIHGVLLNEKFNPAKSCQYFGIIGAAILHIHYKQKAHPVAGFAAYRVDERNVMSFGVEKDGVRTSGSDAFHCWVQCGNWLLDFTSALFPEILNSCGIQKTYERKMFQKQESEMSHSVSELRNPGHFVYAGNQDLTNQIVASFFSVPLNVDLVDICVDWYRRPPRKMLEINPVSDAKGNVKQTKLSPLLLSGAW
jgi:hypothetical protein